ncbi:MAG: rhomboid family intramembrane serine protease [Verrucomicrobiae bacterium]|nr:rhomboid family intramembrane serine protease [Verrucomicrobiae bacterium]
MLAYLENKFGRFAIPHLIPGIVFLSTITFVLLRFQPDFINYLVLNPQLILQGEVWRLFTYVFIPPTVNLFWIIFALMFLWMLGNGLEQAWGAFRVNLYFFIGLLSTTLIAFIFNWVDATGGFIYSTIFFAFATLYPNYQILVFFILPIKVKWLAYFSLFILIVYFFNTSFAGKISLLIAHLNYFLFFGKDIARILFQRRSAHLRKKKIQSHPRPVSEAFHNCFVCKKTDLTNPHLHFRIAADGQEYCLEHLPKAIPK